MQNPTPQDPAQGLAHTGTSGIAEGINNHVHTHGILGNGSEFDLNTLMFT